jgi:hypothetical protein
MPVKSFIFNGFKVDLRSSSSHRSANEDLPKAWQVCNGNRDYCIGKARPIPALAESKNRGRTIFPLHFHAAQYEPFS